MLTIQQIKKQIDEQKKKTQALAKAKAPVGTTNAEARAERLSLPKPVLTPKVAPKTGVYAVDRESRETPDVLGAYLQMLKVTKEKGPQQISSPGLAGAQKGLADMFMYKAPTTPDPIYNRTYEQIKALNPKTTTAGYIGGIGIGSLPSIAMGRGITANLPTMGKAATFGAGLAADTAVDVLSTLPGAVSSGISGKDYAKATGINIGANVALAGTFSVLGKAIRSIKSGAKTADVVADIAQNAPETKVSIQQELGLPEESTWDDIQRKLDEEEAVEALYQKYAEYEPKPKETVTIHASEPNVTDYYIPSNVIDSNQPIVIKGYRGYNPKNTEVDEDAFLGGGKYFSNNKRTAEHFKEFRGEGATVEEKDIVLKTPFTNTYLNKNTPQYAKLVDDLESIGLKRGVIERALAGEAEEKPFRTLSVSLSKNKGVSNKEAKTILNKAIENAGYDGIVNELKGYGEFPDNVEVLLFKSAKDNVKPSSAVDIERELFPSVERPITPSPKLPEPALKTAYERANAPRQAIAPELTVNTAQGEITPSMAIGERVTPEPSIKLDKASGGAGIEPKIAKVEPVTGGTQTRTAKQQVDIDAITEPGTSERGLSQNVATDLNRPQQTIDSFNDDPIFYEKLSNKTTLEKAQSILDKGYDNALEEYKRMGRTFEAHKVPLGIKLSDEAVARGDFNTSREILADLAEELTSAGQFSQAANILRRSNDPEAATLFIHRQIAKLNKDGAEQYGKKWTPVDLTDEELQAIKDSAGDQTKYDATMENIYNRIAKQIPSSNREKFDAWRRMAMLMNPKTHVRNIVGNTLMKGLERVSDSISQAIETVVKPTVRTKAIGWSKDADLVKTVQESWETAKPDLTNASKYEISGLKAFNREKPIFKTKWIEFINNLSKESLEAEDVFFMKGAYQDALGQYMKANNLKAPNANATEYAKQKALEATFRQTNALSTFIEGIKRKKGLPGMLAEAAIPFSKTPANILMRGVDYSPFGLTKLLSTKSRTPDEIIDIISKGATGSSLVGLGMLLADNGWARGDYTTAKKEGLAEVTGEQPMSIITPQGSYTFDWAQPAAVPLAMGIAIQENLKKKNPDAAKIVLEAAAAGGDAIINMSMLQNLKDLMGGGFESPTENVISLPKQYLEQAFPSVVGQIARISDPKQRISYAETETQKALNQIKSKTPGARQTLEPKIDILGREVSAGKLPTRVIQNLLSPGTIKKKDNEPVVLELSRLYETNRDTRIIPRVAPKTLERTVKGDKQEMKLTAEQLTKFQRGMGTSNMNDLKSLFNSSSYKMASEENKMKMVRNIVEDNYDEEKARAFSSGESY